ncbi:MAG: hypothetical protein ACW99U_02235 [Candidatus Thorarchaeota archaeon]
MALVELSAQQSIYISIILPLIPVLIAILGWIWIRRNPDSRILGKLSFLGRAQGTIEQKKEGDSLSSESEKLQLKNQLLTTLAFVYIAIALFLISNVIAEFYVVVGDISFNITQGTTDFARTVTSVEILNPFYGGWIGSFPWYGSFELPPTNSEVFHNTWNWVFFTAARTDNANFFGGMIEDMFYRVLPFGILFLLPLAIRSIRESAVPSFFQLITSMTITSRVTFGVFAQAWNLHFGGTTLQYGIAVVNGEMLPVLTTVLGYAVVFIVGIYIVYVVLAVGLWRVHYPQKERSKVSYILLVSAYYWLSLIFSVVMLT